MPTSTNVTNLKINELTEAQYDTAVQGGVIGANELSIITDLDDAIQVSSLPTAAAGEVGKVYQFIGTTDVSYTHGYFYECVSDGGNPATYSWSQLNVQPAGSSLPSQTGNSGKFLTTDGTSASWSDKPLVNKATGNAAITIDGTACTYQASINIGYSSQADEEYCSVLGVYAKAWWKYGTAIGYSAVSGKNYATAIGYSANANGQYAIQLGYGTNSTDSTFSVGFASGGNYRLLSSNGTIPADRLPNAINKYDTMPTAASGKLGWIVQYTGATDSTYTHGYIYECVSDGGNPATYSWSALSVQAGGGGGSTAATGTLVAANWSSGSQTINVTGVTASNNVIVAPAPASQAAYTSAGIICTAQGSGTLTFTCTTTPSSDLTVNVLII